MNSERITKIELVIQRVLVRHSDAINGVKLFQSGSKTLNFVFTKKIECPASCPCNDRSTHWTSYEKEGLEMELIRVGVRYFDVLMNSTNIVLVDNSY